MGTESVALPDGVRLKAAIYLHHEPQPWKGSSLRRRLVVSLAVTLAVFAGVVMFWSYTLGSAIAPYTSAEPLRPAKPQAITIVDSRFSQDTTPWLVGFGAIAYTGMAATYLAPAAMSYRRARRLVQRGPGWRELTATVKSSVSGRTGTTLVLEADDEMERPRTFTLWQFGSLPWNPTPKRGERLVFALLSDGSSSYALISTSDRPQPRLVRVQVPNDFELRAMGA